MAKRHSFSDDASLLWSELVSGPTAGKKVATLPFGASSLAGHADTHAGKERYKM